MREAHETPDTKHGLDGRSVPRGCARGRTTGNRRPNRRACRQVTASLFTIVRHCSPLFTIVQYFFWGLECTEPVFKHCLRYWAGLTTKAVGLYFSPHAEAKCMRGLAGRGASRLPRATRPLRFFTNHESRKMAFMAVRFASPADKSWIPHEAFARHGAAWRGNLVAQSLLAFPEFPRISHYFPLKKLSDPMSANRQSFWIGLTTNAVGLYFSPHGEAKCMREPAGRGASRLPPATRPLRFFTKHESRLYCVDGVFDKRAPAGSRGFRGESRAGWSGCASSSERKSHGPR